mmetsp:Transcript_25451/g.30879  ORF Transcript_25451/g.30879 Transcript_25451/m.30879 type:complete len:763 (-) Transcript_25451:569-2857(-)
MTTSATSGPPPRITRRGTVAPSWAPPARRSNAAAGATARDPSGRFAAPSTRNQTNTQSAIQDKHIERLRTQLQQQQDSQNSERVMSAQTLQALNTKIAELEEQVRSERRHRYYQTQVVQALKEQLGDIEQQPRKRKGKLRASKSHNAKTVRAQLSNLGAELHALLDDRFADNEAIVAALSDYLQDNDEILESIVQQTGKQKAIQQEAFDEVCQQWSPLLGVAIRYRLRLSNEKYQLLLSMLSKDYNVVEQKYQPKETACGAEYPKLSSLRQVSRKAEEIFSTYDPQQSLDGKDTSVSLKNILIKELQHSGGDNLGNCLNVHLLADAASWMRGVKQTTVAAKIIYPHIDVAQSPFQVHSVLCFEGSDEHTQIQERTDRLISEMKELKAEGMKVEDESLKVWFTLGGDLAFLNSILTLSGCSATWCCVWCHKTLQTLHKFGLKEPLRTLDELQKLSHTWCGSKFKCPACQKTFSTPQQCADSAPTTEYSRLKYQREHYGVRFGLKTVFPIEPKDCIPDILHLLLRIVDCLFWRTIRGKLSGQEKELIEVVRHQVGAYIKEISGPKQSEKGSEIKKVTFIGRECITLVEKIELVVDVVTEASSQLNRDIVAAWKSFGEVWNALSSPMNKPLPHQEAREERASQLERLSAEFIEHFKTVSADGTETLYFHVLVDHIPFFVRRYGDLRHYSSSALEHLHAMRKADGKALTNKRKAIFSQEIVQGRGKKMRQTRTYQVVKAEYTRKEVDKELPAKITRWERLRRKAVA